MLRYHSVRCHGRALHAFVGHLLLYCALAPDYESFRCLLEKFKDVRSHKEQNLELVSVIQRSLKSYLTHA